MTLTPCSRCADKRSRIVRLEEIVSQQRSTIGEQSAEIVSLAALVAEVRPEMISAAVRRIVANNPTLTNPESPLAEYRREHIRKLERL